jgi:hypothetical protein
MIASGSNASDRSEDRSIMNVAPTKGGSNFAKMLGGKVFPHVEMALSKMKLSM